MKPVRVLDAAHILAVCTHAANPDAANPDAAGTRRGQEPPDIALAATTEAVTIRIVADQARIAAVLRALHQAGYNADADGDLITVRGWSRVRLARRLVQLDAAVQYLTEQLAFTPRTAVAHYETAVQRPAMTGRTARNHARERVVGNLRDRAQRRTGPLSRHDLPDPPIDPGTELLLCQCGWLEDEIDLLLNRHRAIATQAIAEHRLTTAHGTETARNHKAATAEATAEAESITPAEVQPAAVAAHDAPTPASDADALPAPDTNGAPPAPEPQPVTPPARRGA